MKFTNTIITLLVILFLSLLIGTFLAVKSQEGITYNELTILKEIVNNTNLSNIESNMNAIKLMNIEDTDFAKIINHKSLSNDNKVKKLKKMVKKLSDDNISGKKYEDAWDEDI